MPNETTPFLTNIPFGEGKPVSATQMNRIVDNLVRRIQGDNKTIRVRTFGGGQIIIEAMSQRGVGGGAAGGWVKAETLEGLPPTAGLPITTQCRITGDGGADVFKGGVGVINPEGTGWNLTNFFQ